MKNSNISKLIQTVANLGVIAGIIFLAIEIRQNNELLDAQSRLAKHEMRSNDSNRIFFETANLSEILIKITNNQELTELEILVLGRYYRQILLNWEFEFIEFQNGLLEEFETSYLSWSSTLNSYPLMLEIWDGVKDIHHPDFVEFMEQNIETR